MDAMELGICLERVIKTAGKLADVLFTMAQAQND
jgi:hypothetical protein